MDDTLYKNCTLIDFEKRLSSSFAQVESIVQGFSALYGKLGNDPQQLDLCQEQLMMYQVLSKDNVQEQVWNDAMVKAVEGSYFCMHLRDKFPLLSSVAVYVLTIRHKIVFYQ